MSAAVRPSARPRPWLVRGLLGVTLAICLGTAVFSLTLDAVEPPIWGMRWSAGVWAVAFGAVGAIVAARRPGNPIGWLLLVAGLLSALLNIATEMSAATTDLGPVLADRAYWVGGWLWIPTVAVLAGALFLFPDGRPRSPRWTPVIVFHVLLTVVVVALVMLAPDAQGGSRISRGPLMDPSAGVTSAARVALTMWQAMLLVAMGSVIARRFGADAATRRQLRWIAFAAGVVFLLAATVEIGYSLAIIERDTYRIGAAALSLAMPLIPIAIGIAVLRYRLYEIDRILSRTVAYGLLSATLGALYLAIVLAFHGVFTDRAGGVPDVVVAGATLVIAGVFQPLRRRIQAFVDARFNRRLVDAARTIDRFSSDLRGEVEQAAIATRLRATAYETVEPRSASVWVRPV